MLKFLLNIKHNDITLKRTWGGWDLNPYLKISGPLFYPLNYRPIFLLFPAFLLLRQSLFFQLERLSKLLPYYLMASKYKKGLTSAYYKIFYLKLLKARTL